MKKVRLATVWLDGCSGCHMSLLDMDEAHSDRRPARRRGLRAAGGRAGVSRRRRCDAGRRRGQFAGGPGEDPAPSASAAELVVSLGDCAVTGNVPAMRNQIAVAQAARAHLRRRRAGNRAIPATAFPPLLRAGACRCTSSSRWISHVPGCPPSAKAIAFVLTN